MRFTDTNGNVWNVPTDTDRKRYRQIARAALTAALDGDA